MLIVPLFVRVPPTFSTVVATILPLVKFVKELLFVTVVEYILPLLLVVPLFVNEVKESPSAPMFAWLFNVAPVLTVILFESIAPLPLLVSEPEDTVIESTLIEPVFELVPFVTRLPVLLVPILPELVNPLFTVKVLLPRATAVLLVFEFVKLPTEVLLLNVRLPDELLIAPLIVSPAPIATEPPVIPNVAPELTDKLTAFAIVEPVPKL